MKNNLHTISRVLCVLLSTLCLVGCGEYQQILKSKDPDIKYHKALDYFNNKEYVKAQTLLDEITTYYKGTDRAQDVLTYLSRSHMGQKNYSAAAEYYQAYIRNYPKGRYIMEARFQVGHCYYLDVADARLDQADTKKAIQFYTQFVEQHPDSHYAEQAYKEMNELYDRLAYKEYLNAKLYYNLGSYLGNNYLSAEIVAKNALKNYPTNKYQEELSWIVLQAKYQQAINSVDDKKQERAIDTNDEYYSFVTQFPESKHINAATKIHKEMEKLLEN